MMMDLPLLIAKYNMKIKSIAHIGANDGQERVLYKSIGVDEVFWVEALPSMYERLVKNIADYPNNKAFNACVSYVDGSMVTFKVSNNDAQSSSYLELGVHSIIHPTVNYIDTIEMKTQRLDTLFKGVDVSRVNFANFDIQGAELDAIIGMGDLLSQMDYLWLEVNKKETYVGCALVDEIDVFLSEYTRVETGAWVSDTWTDALYIKTKLL